jgi:hypothetical protein
MAASSVKKRVYKRHFYEDYLWWCQLNQLRNDLEDP